MIIVELLFEGYLIRSNNLANNTEPFSIFHIFYCVMEEEKDKIPVWFAEAPLILFIEYHFWICFEAWYHSLVYFELSFCKFWMEKKRMQGQCKGFA